MGELFNKLFQWQYFEPVLFTSIGVLLLLLFIVLFLGKKDQKKQLEETKKLELDGLKEESTDAFAKTDDEPAPVEIKDEVEEKEEEKKEEEPKEEKEEEKVSEPEPTVVPDFEIFSKSNEDEEETKDIDEEKEEKTSVEDIDIPPVVVSDEPKEEKEEIIKDPISVVDDVVKSAVVPEEEAEEKEEEIKEINEEQVKEIKNNFADLASSISKELDEINKMQNGISKDEEKEEKTLPGEIDVTPIKEVTKFTPSDVFSSVYSPSDSDKEKSIFDDEKKDDSNPFINDMPIKKDEKEDMELPKESNEPVNVPDFSAFDNETYNIEK